MKILVVIALFLVTWTKAQKKGPCFEFNGGSYLEFDPDNFDISNSIHYTFEFQTNQTDGILMYAKGSHDYEAVLIRDGYLYYVLLNPEYSGTGSSFGARLRSNHRVNNNTIFSVEVFRNRRVRRGQALMPGERPPLETGMVLKDASGTGPEEEHLVRRGRLNGVQILTPVYIGGAGHEVSRSVGHFIGKIMNIREKKTGRTFVDPSRNIGVTRCLSGRSVS